MVLRTEVVAGTLSGWEYVGWSGKVWQPPVSRAAWSVAVGFLPQLVVFYLSRTVDIVADLLNQNVLDNLANGKCVGSAHKDILLPWHADCFTSLSSRPREGWDILVVLC